MKNKQCWNCGSEFAPKNGQRTFCCLPCRFEYEKKRAKEYRAKKKIASEQGIDIRVIECRRCGIRFNPDSASFRYCSDECREAAEKAQNRARRKVRIRKTLDDHISHDWILAECPFFSGAIEQDMGMLYA